ncbi:amino acid permease [Truncatella angustata]|uniref:Amino acid permease n=1 Tax=Truncatella angustata TaxID=152316 RepID=A0A9P8UUV8_9PEZI|nr:amino acid permease [Truncatella angustata]KAH6658440.1 amino acid permease [Truncatella angustata]
MKHSIDLKRQDSNVAEHGHGTQISEAARLEQLGYTQELPREFSMWSMMALCMCLMATWEALSSVLGSAIVNGGAPCLFYNYVLSFICTIAITCSLGEIASIYPTAGGQYHWVAALAPSSTRSAAAWFTGWISIGGQVVLTASAAFAAALQIQGLAVLNNGDTYVPERYQAMLIFWLILVYGAVMNVYGHKLLPTVNLASAVLHVLGFLAIFITLAIMAPKNDSSFVFVEVANSSGWSNDGVSWLVGLLSAVYPFLGYDAACHMAEEIPNASRNVPIAMVGSSVVNGLIGFAYCIMLLYCTGPVEDLFTTPTGFPFMQIFLYATDSSAGATLLSLSVTLTAVAATVAGIASTSRTLWAFARDAATPFHASISAVDGRNEVPTVAILVITVLQMLLGFIYLGNSTAFNAILAMAVIGMYLSYVLPICYMLLHGRSRLARADYGPFRLGRPLGVVLNLVSVVWLVVSILFSTFPSAMPVTAQTMNYSSVVMAGWMAFGTAYYFAWGRKCFRVPEVRTSEVYVGVQVPEK